MLRPERDPRRGTDRPRPTVPDTPPSPSLERIPALDGVRALAVTLIVVFHYFYGTLDASLRSGLVGLAHQAAALGWAAMDIFFVLSGFLIGRILIVTRARPGYFRTFYLRRVFRIFPPYFLVLGLFVVLLATPLAARLPWLFDDPAPLWSYALFVQNFYMNDGFGANWTGVSWSLALEEQFYLLFPLIVLFVPVRRLPLVLLGGAALAFVARAVLSSSGGYAGYVLLPARMDALLLGALVAWLHVHGDLVAGARRHRVALVAVFLSSLAAALLARVLLGEGLGGPTTHTAFSVATALFIVWTIAGNRAHPLARLFGSAPARALATISYTVYLLHQPVLGLVHGLLLDQEPTVAGATDAVATLAALAVVVALAALSWQRFEKPLLDAGRRRFG